MRYIKLTSSKSNQKRLRLEPAPLLRRAEETTTWVIAVISLNQIIFIGNWIQRKSILIDLLLDLANLFAKKAFYFRVPFGKT